MGESVRRGRVPAFLCPALLFVAPLSIDAIGTSVPAADRGRPESIAAENACIGLIALEAIKRITPTGTVDSEECTTTPCTTRRYAVSQLRPGAN